MDSLFMNVSLLLSVLPSQEEKIDGLFVYENDDMFFLLHNFLSR